MNTYTINLGITDENGNELYYVPAYGRNLSAPKADGYVFTSFDELENVLEYRKSEFRSYANTYNWHVTVEENGKPFECEDIESVLGYINLRNEEVEVERVRRLKELKVEPLALKEAIENKTIYISENTGLPFNINYFIDGYTYEKEVRQTLGFINKAVGVPYWVIVDHLRDGGLLINILYVSLYKEDWKWERLHGENYISACVVNTGFEFPDYGYIKVALIGGSVKRLYD